MARDLNPERVDKRGVQKNWRAIEALLDLLFDAGGAVILSHGDLADLAAGDDHTQYVLLAGRSGGQLVEQGLTVEDGLIAEGTGGPTQTIVVQRSDATATTVLITNTNATSQIVQYVLTNPNGSWRFRLSASGNFQFFDALASANVVQLLKSAVANSIVVGPSGVAFFGTGSFGGGIGVFFQANRTTAPTSNPAAGGISYNEAGARMYRGSGGSITTVAPA